MAAGAAAGAQSLAVEWEADDEPLGTGGAGELDIEAPEEEGVEAVDCGRSGRSADAERPPAGAGVGAARLDAENGPAQLDSGAVRSPVYHTVTPRDRGAD